jgi:hypothetical protein
MKRDRVNLLRVGKPSRKGTNEANRTNGTDNQVEGRRHKEEVLLLTKWFCCERTVGDSIADAGKRLGIEGENVNQLTL